MNEVGVITDINNEGVFVKCNNNSYVFVEFAKVLYVPGIGDEVWLDNEQFVSKFVRPEGPTGTQQAEKDRELLYNNYYALKIHAAKSGIKGIRSLFGAVLSAASVVMYIFLMRKSRADTQFDDVLFLNIAMLSMSLYISGYIIGGCNFRLIAKAAAKSFMFFFKIAKNLTNIFVGFYSLIVTVVLLFPAAIAFEFAIVSVPLIFVVSFFIFPAVTIICHAATLLSDRRWAERMAMDELMHHIKAYSSQTNIET